MSLVISVSVKEEKKIRDTKDTDCENKGIDNKFVKLVGLNSYFPSC